MRGSATTVAGSLSGMPAAARDSCDRYSRPIEASSSRSRNILVSCRARPRWCDSSTPAFCSMPNTLTDSRPTALATRSQYRSRVMWSGAITGPATSMAMPSITATKSAFSRPYCSTAVIRKAAWPGSRFSYRASMSRRHWSSAAARCAGSPSRSSAISSTARQKA